MPSDNRKQVRMPRRLADDLMLALDQCLRQLEQLDPDPGIVTRQVHDHGDRVLREARRRLSEETRVSTMKQETKLPDPGHCACGRRGSWDRPMYGTSRDMPVAWPTCPDHESQATGAPVPRDEYRRVMGDD